MISSRRITSLHPALSHDTTQSLSSGGIFAEQSCLESCCTAWSFMLGLSPSPQDPQSPQNPRSQTCLRSTRRSPARRGPFSLPRRQRQRLRISSLLFGIQAYLSEEPAVVVMVGQIFDGSSLMVALAVEIFWWVTSSRMTKGLRPW